MSPETTDNLTQKKCVPCEGGVPKLDAAEAAALLPQVSGWTLEGEKLTRHFGFADFAQAMVFVNRMADVAEAEGHHPDFAVHWNQVEVTIWTHAIGGLSENDFILAAKLSPLADAQ